jgi:hypothetical protein
MHFIPGLRLRASEEAEILGIDDAEMGEYAYDYVGLDTELAPTTTKGMQHDEFETGGGREPPHGLAAKAQEMGAPRTVESDGSVREKGQEVTEVV